MHSRTVSQSIGNYHSILLIDGINPSFFLILSPVIRDTPWDKCVVHPRCARAMWEGDNSKLYHISVITSHAWNSVWQLSCWTFIMFSIWNALQRYVGVRLIFKCGTFGRTVHERHCHARSVYIFWPYLNQTPPICCTKISWLLEREWDPSPWIQRYLCLTCYTGLQGCLLTL